MGPQRFYSNVTVSRPKHAITVSPLQVPFISPASTRRLFIRPFADS